MVWPSPEWSGNPLNMSWTRVTFLRLRYLRLMSSHISIHNIHDPDAIKLRIQSRMTKFIQINMTFPLLEYWASLWLLGFPVLYPVQMANTARHHHQIIKLFKIYLSHQISQRFIGWLNTDIRYNSWFWGTKCVSEGYFISEIQCFVTRECVNTWDLLE